MEQLKQLYTQTFGEAPFDVEPLAGAGSNRRYVRFVNRQGRGVIGVVGTSQEENAAFLYLSNHLAEKGLPVPQILAVSRDKMRYLQQDLGSRSLFDALRQGRISGGNYSEEEVGLLEKAMRLLPRVQMKAAADMDWSVCYPKPAFDRESIMFDLNYFKYCYLKPLGADFHESLLEKDFCRLADHLLCHPAEAFMYRDFQARNIMLDGNDNLYLIDYQGGRRGPVCYDVASFLWQASARYPESLRGRLVETYFNALQANGGAQRETLSKFKQSLSLFVFFRLLQVLGAYGFRGYFERKQHFIDSIPPALANLRQLLAEGIADPYPHLRKVLLDIQELRSDRSDRSEGAEDNSLAAPSLSPVENREAPSPRSLQVRIYSFSYKKGIPADESGNGGGYVFDCRSTHNPGRYEPYKQLTGLDEPVIRFLEDDGEILSFLQNIYPLAEHHVERFLQRGFTHLMFAFGCTGGQHRSVYCAQHLAEHLHRKYGVEVHLCHREQGINTHFE